MVDLEAVEVAGVVGRRLIARVVADETLSARPGIVPVEVDVVIERAATYPDDNDPVEVTNIEWDVDDTYDHYVESGPNAGAPYPMPRDTYDPALGFQLTPHHGLRLLLKAGAPNAAINPGHFFPITLVAGQTGASIYQSNISGCNPDAIVTLPGILPVELGNMIGPTRQGMQSLIAQDPGATWVDAVNPATGLRGYISGGCTPNCATPTGQSPRLRPVALFDPDAYDAGRGSGRLDINLQRWGGFFVQRMIGNDVQGHLTKAPAVGGGGPLNDPNAFLRTVILVR